jgi:two-component SAPR family response regulator
MTKVDVIELDVAVRWLIVGLVVTIAWVIIALVVQSVMTLRGSTRSFGLLPGWMRVAVLTVISSIAVPKVAHATSPTTVGATDPGEARSDNAAGVLLAGSLAANAGFVALHLRRRLVEMRTQRFGMSDEARTVKCVGERVDPLSEPEWSVLVRVLGPPAVTTARGERVSFDRGKALELLVWMTEHREVSTRSAARTALWEGMVKDATFSNVVSEVRRSLNSSHPGDVVEWIPRTFTDELPLHSGVVTDAELLDIATKNFEKDNARCVGELVRRLSEVRNLPFSGADYAWADGEGITTSHVIKVVKAAVLLGEYAIENDDSELLFMATERGLRVLPGHEQLVSLRMRGHARGGNRTAIKYEWESYARAIASDSWAGATPSAELENLARQLSQQ